MNINNAIVTAVAGFALVPAMSWAGTIGGVQYASQYDYREFFAVTDHHDFHVGLAGNPFPGSELGVVARDLLPAMQSNKPRPALIFTYDPAVETNQPDYRLMLVFDAANDLSSKDVCNGVTRLSPASLACSTSMPSIAATTGRCRRRRPGRRPAGGERSARRPAPSRSCSRSWFNRLAGVAAPTWAKSSRN